MTQLQPIQVEIAPGELIDKLTILEIKARRMADTLKLQNVLFERDALARTRDAAIPPSPQLEELTRQLRAVNQSLWEIEDQIRDCERLQDFGTRFVQLARSVYRQNDLRAALKRQINQLLGSKLIEEKSYSVY
jgi:hypothetical protein